MKNIFVKILGMAAESFFASIAFVVGVPFMFCEYILQCPELIGHREEHFVVFAEKIGAKFVKKMIFSASVR